MAEFNKQQESPVARAAAEHARRTGRAPEHTASAPGTWVLIGENVDHFGGVTIIGLIGLRAAAAVSPREDGVVSLCASAPYSQPVTGEIRLADLTAHSGSAGDAAASTDRAAVLRRFAGLVQTMVNKQVLSRDTTGFDITIASDIPVGAGLGALYAADAALALALAGGHAEVNEPPMRARLAEICSQSASTYSTLAILRARHTAALRGAAELINVVDYADGSLTTALHPGKLGVRIFSIARQLGAPYAEQKERIAVWRGFIDDAANNFGVSSLRELPDSVDRVGDWVEARHDVGDEHAPEPATARRWVSFCESETLRSLATAKALRSRRGNELFTLLNSRCEAHSIETPDELVSLALERGAVAARPAAAGTSQAVIAFVPVRRAEDFARKFAQDFEVVEVTPGEPACLEDARG